MVPAPHRDWWRNLLRGGSGTAFWHETYFARGGMESIFLDMDRPTGLLAFAPAAEARGAMFSARRRLRVAGDELVLPPLTEEELYGR
jgi:Monooxygenase af470-like